MKALITTVPFGAVSATPIQLLKEAGIDFTINPTGRRLQPGELKELVSDFDILIAGTEEIDVSVFEAAKNLKLISRVGIGLDGIDLRCAKKSGVTVSYTPDAPAPAVAELTIGLMLSLLRSIQQSNLQMKKGEWNRLFGRRVSEIDIGIVGYGRIGKRVAKHLKAFEPRTIRCFDIDKAKLDDADQIKYTPLEDLLATCDLISFHVPLTQSTFGMISKKEIQSMKKGSYLINTSRGGILDEADVLEYLNNGHLGGVAIDTYETEPYFGALANEVNCINTCHMGSMTFDCRATMEIEAVQEAIRFFRGEPLQSEVPEFELYSQLYMRS